MPAVLLFLLLPTPTHIKHTSTKCQQQHRQPLTCTSPSTSSLHAGASATRPWLLQLPLWTATRHSCLAAAAAQGVLVCFQHHHCTTSPTTSCTEVPQGCMSDAPVTPSSKPAPTTSTSTTTAAHQQTNHHGNLCCYVAPCAALCQKQAPSPSTSYRQYQHDSAAADT